MKRYSIVISRAKGRGRIHYFYGLLPGNKILFQQIVSGAAPNIAAGDRLIILLIQLTKN